MMTREHRDPADEMCREYERVFDPKYLDQIRTRARQFSMKLLSRQSSIAECAIRDFKNRKNTIKPLTLRKLTKAIHNLQNKSMKSRNDWRRRPRHPGTSSQSRSSRVLPSAYRT